MPFINLLPPEDRKKGMDYRQWLLVGGAFVLIIGLALLYMTASYQLEQLESEYAGLENQLKVAQPMLGKVEKTEEELATWQIRLAAIESLGTQQQYAELFITISGLIPPQVSLTGLTLVGKELALEGESGDYRGIAAFMDKLETTPWFQSVELVSSFTSRDDSGFIGFRIIGKMK